MIYVIGIVLAIAFTQPSLAMPETYTEHTDINKLNTRDIEEAVKPEDEPRPALTEELAESTTSAPESRPETAQVEQSMPAEALTCEQAIRHVWPPALQDGAILVSQYENRSQNPAAVGAVNPDRFSSQDYGCFQINDHWHPAYFTDGDWQDSVWAAQYALRIYEERRAISGNGWSAWYAVQGILWD